MATKLRCHTAWDVPGRSPANRRLRWRHGRDRRPDRDPQAPSRTAREAGLGRRARAPGGRGRGRHRRDHVPRRVPRPCASTSSCARSTMNVHVHQLAVVGPEVGRRNVRGVVARLVRSCRGIASRDRRAAPGRHRCATTCIRAPLGPSAFLQQRARTPRLYRSSESSSAIATSA
jgi:hypothetical protein